SEVMTIGTLYFTHISRSCCRRELERCTIWLTANGAAGLSGLAWFQASSSSVMRLSHTSGWSAGRAFSAGKEPTTPALHWAMTRSGLDRMNIGDATAGRRRVFRISGKDMEHTSK